MTCFLHFPQQMNIHDWTLEDVSLLLDNYLPDLFSVKNGMRFLRNLATSSQYSKNLLSALAKIAASNQVSGSTKLRKQN